MPSITRATDRNKGNAIVRRAIRHGLVPDFKQGAPLKEQTPKVQWSLHVLAMMSKDGKADMNEVKHVLEQTEDLFQQ